MNLFIFLFCFKFRIDVTAVMPTGEGGWHDATIGLGRAINFEPPNEMDYDYGDINSNVFSLLNACDDGEMIISIDENIDTTQYINETAQGDDYSISDDYYSVAYDEQEEEQQVID